MVMPVGHRTEIKRPLPSRERRFIALIGALTVAIIVGVVIGIAGGGAKPNPRCLNISFASSLGVQNVTKCGAEAREACAEQTGRYGFRGAAAPLVVAECHRLKLPIG